MADEDAAPKTFYRIRDWDKLYENSQSRPIKDLPWVKTQIVVGTDEYLELQSDPEGMAHFGCWNALVQLAARCHPRGSLLRYDAKPHTIETLARNCGVTVATLERAIFRLCSIGWVEQVSFTTHVYSDAYRSRGLPVPAQQHSSLTPVASQQPATSHARAERRRRGDKEEIQPPNPPSQNGKGAGRSDRTQSTKPDRLLEEAKRREQEKRNAPSH
jgi:hypothetical protein